MSRSHKHSTGSLTWANYKVGYGKPPKATRFKRGRSGNPKGRPKGSLNLATDLAAELGEQITVREDGRPRRISKQRALIKSLMAKALQGDVRATAALLALYARVITEPPEDTNEPLEPTNFRSSAASDRGSSSPSSRKTSAKMKSIRQVADTALPQSLRCLRAIAPSRRSTRGQRLIANWHIDAICYWIQKMVEGESRKRLVLNLPPRTLKSFIVSVCLPAWLLGRDPGAGSSAPATREDLPHQILPGLPGADGDAVLQARLSPHPA